MAIAMMPDAQYELSYDGFTKMIRIKYEDKDILADVMGKASAQLPAPKKK